MNWLFGYSKERLGLGVHKVVVVKPLTDLNEDLVADHYVRVAQCYKGDGESKLKTALGEFPWSPKTFFYQAGQVKLHYITEDGEALKASGGWRIACDKAECDRHKVALVVKSMVSSGLAGGWLIPLLLLGMGLVVGLMVGMNLPTIGRMINPGLVNGTRVG